jgi:hypothetical protein
MICIGRRSSAEWSSSALNPTQFPPFDPLGPANQATKPSDNYWLPRLDLKLQSDTERWSETDHQASIWKLEKECRLEQCKGLYQATLFIKEIVHERINKADLLNSRAFSQERLKFTKYIINQGMKSPTVNLPLVFTYSSPISGSLSRQWNDPASIPYCITFTKYKQTNPSVGFEIWEEGGQQSPTRHG